MLYSFTEKHKNFLYSIAIFLCVFIPLSILSSNWGFDIDDCGVILGSRFINLQSFINLFKISDQYGLYLPSNYSAPQHNFIGSMSGFYRPITLVFFGIQYTLFGAWPYGYVLIMIFFHALNAALLFNLFLFFISYFWAIWGALFFAYHISLWGWMSWIAAQPYTTSLNFLILATILFFYSLKKNKIAYLLLSCSLYAIAVFLFEFTIVFPLFITSCFLIYDFLRKPLQLPTYLGKSFFSFFKKTIFLWSVTIFFLIARFMACIKNNNQTSLTVSTSINNLIFSLKTRTADLISFLVDICNISFIPSGNQILKGSLVLLVLSLLLFLFYKNKQKKIIIFFFVSTILFLWPAILKHYTLRYFYFSLPLYIFMILLLFKNTDYAHHIKLKKITTLIALVILGGNIFFVSSRLKTRGLFLKDKADVISELLAHKNINSGPLCFIGIPRSTFSTALAQQLWMCGLNESQPIYFDLSLFARTQATNEKNHLKIEQIENGFKLKSLDPQKLWWDSWGGGEMPMGNKTVHKTDKNTGHIYEISIVLDKKHLNKKLIFITWDYVKNKFMILD
ncbi:MAG: hypothetical protein ABH827_03350 [bacterium]